MQDGAASSNVEKAPKIEALCVNEADDVCRGLKHAELGREAVKLLLSIPSVWEGVMATCACVLQNKSSVGLLAGELE